MDEQFRAAFACGGEVHFQGGDFCADANVIFAAERAPALSVFIARQDVRIRFRRGFCPDFDLVIRRFERKARLGEFDVSVAAAGIGDVEHVSAFLQSRRALRRTADAARPAVAFGLQIVVEIKIQVLGLLLRLTGNRQRAVCLRRERTRIGDGVRQFVVAGRGGRGFAVCEGQLGRGADDDCRSEVSVLGVRRRNAREGVEFAARLHACRVLDAFQRRSGIFAALAAAGRKHSRAQQQCRDDRKNLFHFSSPYCLFFMPIVRLHTCRMRPGTLSGSA